MLTIFLSITSLTMGQVQRVNLNNSGDGWTLLIDGKPQVINGMNWDYYPVGEGNSYSLWNQPPNVIKRALDYDMSMLKNMGVNAIRVYTGIPQKWITYIYKNYGIYTMLNYSFGRYGVTLDGAWMPHTDYSDPRVQKLLLQKVKELAEDYKNTPGLLLYLLGNENNYGLFWKGAETEDIPFEDRSSTKMAHHLYRLFNKAAVEIKSIDSGHPVALSNGDVLFLNIIAKEAPDVDIYGTNVYRGISFTDLYQQVKETYGKPVLLTEFGSDAFNAKTMEEDQRDQAHYLRNNWKEIYENAAGMGKSDNSIGGFTFQFSDGWWKYDQTTNFDVHDINASWSNGGYAFDYVEGENNMNEEWFGITAKGPTNQMGLYNLYPRAAYYVLKQAHKYNPYSPGASLHSAEHYFGNISIEDAVLRARSDKAALHSENAGKIQLSQLTADLSTYYTGGRLITTPDVADPVSNTYPSYKGFGDLESFYFGVRANPAPNMDANVVTNILGNVPGNPIDEIFYENRGRPVQLAGANNKIINDDSFNRVAIYRANYNWNNKYFNLNGFYRTGHYHWGYEGDFFNLYPEANYGPNIDIYNGIAPVGLEIEGKKMLNGLKLAFGPQLWWGANPAFLVKYSKNVGQTTFTGIYHEDIQQRTNTQSSFAIPQPKTRRLTVVANRAFNHLGVEIGGIWGGQPLNGDDFQLVRKQADGSYNIYQDQIKSTDNWGGKLKLTYSKGLFNWYAQSSVMGLVANGGPDQTLTFTGWRLKDSGSGNQYNVLSGFTYNIGYLQIAPNFLWQEPIEGPIPGDVPSPGRPRNILDDPFVVRTNRKETAGEILFTYDPTPATFMYDWDNAKTENAELAFSIGFVYRHLPTTQDAAIGILPDGRTTFAFDGAPPAKDLWEVNARAVSKINANFGFNTTLYGGTAQSNGSDPRTIKRYGMDLQMIYKRLKLNSFVKVNDWGPYDYHQDFNLTYPLQVMTDLSTTFDQPTWLDIPSTRIGVRWTWRSLNRYSPRYAPVNTVNADGEFVPDPTAIGFDNGSEWEFRTYVQINILK